MLRLAQLVKPTDQPPCAVNIEAKLLLPLISNWLLPDCAFSKQDYLGEESIPTSKELRIGVK